MKVDAPEVPLTKSLIKDLAEGIPFRPIVVLEVGGRRFLQVGWNRVRAHKELAQLSQLTPIIAVFSGHGPL
jgi:hypothetical protein